MLKKQIEQDKLKDFAGDEGLEELLKILSAFDNVSENARERFFKDCYKALYSNAIKGKIQVLKAQFEAENDREKRLEIAKKLNELTLKLTKMK